MADWQNERRDLQPEVGTAARWVYLGPFVIILVIVGIALFYWATYDTTPSDERVEPTVGTSGEPTPGGFNPEPKPDNTQEERDARQDAR